MRIVMYFTVLVYREALLAELKDAPEEIVVADTPAELAEVIEGADVFLFNGSAYTPEVAEILRTKGRSVRWYHSSSAGNEPLITTGVPRHVTVTRSGGHSAAIVAEHAIALLLALARGLPFAMENQRARNWIKVRGGPRPGTMRSLFGRTAVVLGFNHIGQEIGRRLKVLGMTVIAVNRSGTPHELADETYPSTQLREALAEASVLVVAAPANPETRGMIGAEELAALQPDGFVVNIGRGPIIQTDAIEAALRDGTILGAGLDVIDPEPLPPEHSIWDAPNLIITPHRAGGGDPTSARRQAQAVLANLERFRAGEPLKHVLATKVVD
ncbi:MAG TPA: D-2-hydroxyacid dehydrogenase [Allosphingosinicella sp.]|nr:D-2-hydroxyacid dehydrogenase [Allosphingosinicella sp.]